MPDDKPHAYAITIIVLGSVMASFTAVTVKHLPMAGMGVGPNALNDSC